MRGGVGGVRCHVLEGASYSCVHCGAAHFLPYLFIAGLGFNQNTPVHGNTNFLVRTYALWQDSDPCSVCGGVCVPLLSFCTLCLVHCSTIYCPHPLGPLFPSLQTQLFSLSCCCPPASHFFSFFPPPPRLLVFLFPTPCLSSHMHRCQSWLLLCHLFHRHLSPCLLSPVRGHMR